MNSSARGIALYDMDGTLFWGDSQLRFARWILRRYGWRRLYLLLVIPAGVLRACHILNTEQMKRLFLSYLWRMPEDQLRKECEAFCTEELTPALYPEILESLRIHQAAGDTTVLCSASPHWWTACLGRMLGYTHSIGTPAQLTEGRVALMPAIDEPGNNKGANKLIRLEKELDITRADVCYTDSKADEPMLSISERAVLVNPNTDMTTRWESRADIRRPSHPAGKIRFILSCVLGI